MKSKLLTKKSVITVSLIICLLISLSFVANKTVVSSRLEEMAYQEEYAPKQSPDGLYLISYEPDNKGNKVGSVLSFIGNDYLLSTSEIPAYCDEAEITSIDEEAFKDGEYLEKVTVPQTVKKIKDKAFANCKSLKEIYIPSDVIEISQNAFNDSTKFKMYVEKDSYAEIYAIKNNIDYEYYTPDTISRQYESDYPKTAYDKSYIDLFYCVYYYNNSPCCAITGYNIMSETAMLTIPKEIDGIKVTSIAPEAFSYCQNIETVVLPDTIIGVGNYAFAESSSLKKVIFGNSDASIGKSIINNSPNAVINASNNSSAQKYAVDNKIEFEEKK